MTTKSESRRGRTGSSRYSTAPTMHNGRDGVQIRVGLAGGGPHCSEPVPRGTKRLSEFALMKDLDGFELAEIERAAFLRIFQKGQVLYLPGDASNAVYFLASGRIKVSRLSIHGKELVLDILGAGEPFGVNEVLCSEPRQTVTEALERGAVWIVRANAFRALVTKRSEVALKLAQIMGRRQSLLEQRLVDVAYKKASQRLADLLLQLGETYGIRDARGILLPLRLSQSVLGNLVGMSREMVNITLSRLTRNGLIALADRRIVIRNVDALAALAA